MYIGWLPETWTMAHLNYGAYLHRVQCRDPIVDRIQVSTTQDPFPGGLPELLKTGFGHRHPIYRQVSLQTTGPHGTLIWSHYIPSLQHTKHGLHF